MNHRIRRLCLSRGGLAALAVLFIVVLLASQHALRNWRLDLTQDRLYTTSAGTSRILRNLRQPIDLWLFYSARTASRYPQVAAHAARVRDLLHEYANHANGQLRLHFVDPQPFSEDEDRATELGINPVGGGNTPWYFGLAGTNAKGGHAVISFLDPARDGLLEYDLSRLIYRLDGAPRPVVGWLTGLPMTAGFDETGHPRQAWVAFEQAQQLLDLRVLNDRTTTIDPAVNVLVLAHPAHLSAATLFAIDQYALRGGHILAFIDPLANQDSGGADPNDPAALIAADRASHLEPLLSAWGVGFDPKQVVLDARYALSINAGSGRSVRHLGLIGLDAGAEVTADPITAGLASINLGTAGFLTRTPGATTTFTPLLQSSDQAMLVPASRLAALTDPATLFSGFKPGGQRYTLAARVTGKVRSAFPGGLPDNAQLPPGQTLLSASVRPLDLVVVADSDVLSDFMWVRTQEVAGQRVAQPFANNGDLLLNAIDNLAGSDDLMSIRGHATYARPFTRITALQARADERLRAKEQELQARLRDTEQRLTRLQQQRTDQGTGSLTPAQDQELQRFQAEKLRIRKELRTVRLGLAQDIDRLEAWLKFLNIVLAPVLFAVLAVLAGLAFRRRRH